MKKLLQLKTMLLLCLMVVGVSSSWATDYTQVMELDLTSKSYGSSTYNTSTTYGDWTIVNGANNNKGWTYFKMGGKSATISSANPCYIYSTAAASDKVDKITVHLPSGSLSKSGMSVNSWGVYVYSDKDLKTQIDYVAGGTITNNEGSFDFTPSAGKTWASGYYYKVSWDLANTTTTNGIVCVDKITLYKAAATTHTLTYSATNGSIAGVDGGSNAVASGASVAENATVTLTATPSDGYVFDSWSVSGTGSTLSSTSTNPTTFTMGTADATVTANFAVAVTSDYITVSPRTASVTSTGEDVELSITTDQSLDEDPTQFYTTADGDETASKPAWITEVLYDEGTLLLTVAPNTGIARTAYLKVEKGSVKSDVITITQAAKTYVIEQYTAPATAHGTITFSPTSPIETGAEVTLTATPDEGYAFTADSWTFYKVSGEDIVADNSITVSSDKFTMPAYELYVDATFAPVAVTGVTLNKTTASLGVGDTETLTATVAPSNALNKAVAWSSSNTSIATVSAAGVVTAVAVGSATITATTDDGSFTATCSVTVENAVTFDATKDTGTSLSKNGVSFTTSATESDVYKIYKNNSTTFAVSVGKITRIEFTNSGGANYKVVNGFSASTGTLTADGNNGIWTGSASSITFTASGNQVRASKIVVYYATTATPTFSVAEGEYSEAKSVAISCATDGANIYYTTDGSTPTSSSTAYSSAIAITESTTLKAIAIKDGVESDVASATYTMNRPEAPTFDVEEGTFASAFTLHLATATDGATIYYTTDGTTPTSSNSAYTTGIDIPAESTTVKAVAVKSGLTSDVATAAYIYDTRPAPTFTLSATSIDLKVKETSSAVTLTTNSDGAVSFACADAHITLTGTGNSRTIKADAAGTYTVTVSTAATSNYLAGNGTITVNVTKKATTIDLATSFTSLDLYVTTSGSVTGTVKYGDEAIDGAEVTYSSSDETVATIASDGAVTYKKAGNTTITASYAGDDEYAASEATYTLVLYDTTPQATEVAISFNNTFFGCSSFTNWTTGTATTLTGINKKVEVTYAKGSSQNMYCSTEQIRCYSGNSLSFTAPAGYFLTAIEFTSGTWNTATPTSGSMNKSNNKLWEGSSNTVSFSWSSTARIESATVTIAPAVTITAAKYATYSSPHKLDFSETGITVYKAKVNGSTVKLTEVTGGIVPANTGVILYKDVDAATTIAVPVTTTDATITDNELVGTTVRTLVAKQSGDNFNYILQNGQDGIVFNMATAEGAYMPANRAYLSTAYDASGAGSRLTVVFGNDEGETTGIDTVDSEKVTANGVAYDLQGRRVENPKKGDLYIVNGRKVVKN